MLHPDVAILLPVASLVKSIIFCYSHFRGGCCCPGRLNGVLASIGDAWLAGLGVCAKKLRLVLGVLLLHQVLGPLLRCQHRELLSTLLHVFFLKTDKSMSQDKFHGVLGFWGFGDFGSLSTMTFLSTKD